MHFVQAQERYLDEVFASVNVTDTVTYGVNVSIAPIILQGSPTPLPVNLKMDVYQPEGDTVSQRPVIIFAISGTFFPPYINGGFNGALKDSANVEFAKRFARRGYVVAVVKYRQGWNALGSPVEQQSTILQAAYRGIQDVRTAVRYFRKTAAEDGNPWKVDPNRIALGGTGTGGYMAYGAAYLKRYEQTLLQKFIDFDKDPPAPFVDTTLLADPYGIKQGQINIPNFPTYSSNFNMGFALSGALGDSSWVEAGDVPFCSMHTWKDPAAPFGVGDVLALNPDTGEPFAVIPTASGGSTTLKRATRLGNQAIFQGVDWGDDPISERAEMLDNGSTGLYTFITPFEKRDAMCLGTGVPGDTTTQWISPWNWFDPVIAEATWNAVFAQAIAAGQQITGAQAVCRNERGGPNDPVSAKAYHDTIAWFLAPRLALALDLNTSVDIDRYVQDRNVEVFPNPSADRIMVHYRGAARPIEQIELMDFTGRLIRRYEVNAPQTVIERQGLPAGMYILKIKVGKTYSTKKIQFN